MEFTGERFVPQCQGEIAAEHYHRYFFASGFVAGKRVLDIASGEGYGTHILAQSAAHVTGVDISPEAVATATQKYAGDRVAFLQGSAATIPQPDAAVDVVVSFETLEHLSEQEAMLSEIRRVLRQDGLLIISTPNKPLYSRQGDNPFHVKELCREEFVSLLKSRFAHVSLLGQKVMYGSLLSGTGGETLLLRQREEDGAVERMPFTEQALPATDRCRPLRVRFSTTLWKKAIWRRNCGKTSQNCKSAMTRRKRALRPWKRHTPPFLPRARGAPRRRCVACGIFSREKGTKAESETPWWGQ